MERPAGDSLYPFEMCFASVWVPAESLSKAFMNAWILFGIILYKAVNFVFWKIEFRVKNRIK